MKTTALFLVSVIFSVCGIGAAKADPLITGSIEYAGTAFVYFDYVAVPYGGPTQHHIVIGRAGEFSFENPPSPSLAPVPYVRIDKVLSPLSADGTYRVIKNEKGTVVEFVGWYAPRNADAESIREFVGLVLRKPRDGGPGKDEWDREMMRMMRKWPNQSLEPTPTAGTSAAEQPLVPAAVVAHL